MSKTPHPDCSRPADCRPAWLPPLSVCQCVNEWMGECEAILNIFKYLKAILNAILKTYKWFEWPLVRKWLYKCSPFAHQDPQTSEPIRLPRRFRCEPAEGAISPDTRLNTLSIS